MPLLPRPGAAINYEIWGDSSRGDWVTLVNGHTRQLNDFRMMGKYLAEQGFRIVALDNRGAGRSEASEAFTLQDMAEDVVALLDELDIDETRLLGISMGGFISQTVALTKPDRVAKLCLVSTAANQRSIRKDDRPWTSDIRDVEAKMLPYFTEDFARRNEVLVRSMLKQIAKAVDEGAFAERSEMQKRATAGFDATARLKGIKAPTLVIHGDQDQIIPVAAGEELARGIPGARLEVLEGAGHLLLAERPRELYAFVGDFFGE